MQKPNRTSLIGTGQNQTTYDALTISSDKWGFLKNWRGSKLIELILNLQSTNDTKRTFYMLGSNYLRINYESTEKLPLDSLKIIEDMKNRGDYTFSNNKVLISNFLGRQSNNGAINRAINNNNGGKNVILDREVHQCELFENKMLCTHAYYVTNLSENIVRFPLTDYDGSYIAEDLEIRYNLINRSILDKATITPVINISVNFVKIKEYPSGGDVYVGEWSVEIDEPLLPNESIAFYRKNQYSGHVIENEGEVSFRPRIPCKELCILLDEKSGKKIEIINVFKADGNGKYLSLEHQHERIIDSIQEKVTIKDTNPSFRYIVIIKRS